MIRLDEIVKGVGRAISGKYAVYAEPPLQVDEEIERYVVVTIIPIAEVHAGPRHTERTVEVDVANIGDGEITNAEFFEFIFDCDAALRPAFAFAGRQIMPEGIRTNITDGVGHYLFQLSFYDTLEGVFDDTTPEMGGYNGQLTMDNEGQGQEQWIIDSGQ